MIFSKMEGPVLNQPDNLNTFRRVVGNSDVRGIFFSEGAKSFVHNVIF